MAIDIDARERFLAEPHVAALAVAEPGRGPLTVPIAPGGELWVLTAAASRKAELIAAALRFSMMVERLTPTVRYVSAEGPVTRSRPGTAADLHEMATWYLPADQVEGYVAMAVAAHGEQVVVHMRPERWLSADLG